MMFSNRFFGYKYIFSEPAKRDLKKLDNQVVKKIISKLDDLVTRKELLAVKMMVGITPTQYRLRVGDYCELLQKHTIMKMLQQLTSPEGHARSHYHTVHRGMTYDLEINTDSLTPEQAADKITEFIHVNATSAGT